MRDTISILYGMAVGLMAIAAGIFVYSVIMGI